MICEGQEAAWTRDKIRVKKDIVLGLSFLTARVPQPQEFLSFVNVDQVSDVGSYANP